MTLHLTRWIPRIPGGRAYDNYEPDRRGACHSRCHSCWAPWCRGFRRRSRRRTSSRVPAGYTVFSWIRRSRCRIAARTATGPRRRGPAIASRPPMPVARIRSIGPGRTGSRTRSCSNVPPARSSGTGNHSRRLANAMDTRSARPRTDIDRPSAMVLCNIINIYLSKIYLL